MRNQVLGPLHDPGQVADAELLAAAIVLAQRLFLAMTMCLRSP
jgi:hypothetical protein